MFKGLKQQKLLCHLTEQLLILLQIVSFFFIFIVSLYWLFELLNCNLLSFMEPLIKIIRDMMQAQFAEELQKGQLGMEGSLFVFIALIGLLLYVMSQIKIFLKYTQANLDKAIIRKKEQDQVRYNQQLQAETKMRIMSYTNIVMLVRITLKNLIKDVYATHNDIKHIDKKQEEVVLIALYNKLKTLPGCAFSKDGRILIITSRNFEEIDTILTSVNDTLAQLNTQLKPKKLTISSNCAVDTFSNNIKLKDIYEDLKTLLELNMPDEILCYTNFCNRYQYKKNPVFETYLRGTYALTEDENIWSIIKKN